MGKTRLARVAEQIREQVSWMLEFEVKDPRVGFVTITAVEVSKDLQHAKIFFTISKSRSSLPKTMAGLSSAASYLRSRLGKQMHIKRIPELSFCYDESIDEGMHIDELLKKVAE